MSFSELGLNPFVLKAVEAAGYTEPSPVQAQAIPAALTGADLLVRPGRSGLQGAAGDAEPQHLGNLVHHHRHAGAAVR